MIVYRVVTAKDILSGKIGEAIPTYRMADQKAQELANETGREVSLISYNTVTRGMEGVETYYPNASAMRERKAQEDLQKRQQAHEARMKKLREENNENLRRMREEFAKARSQYESKQYNASKTQKTKMSVAMSNLQLVEGFDHATLKSQHRKMVMKYHPDRPGGDVKNFQYIQKSYEYILDVKGWK